MLIVSYKRSNLLFLPSYYSETLWWFNYDVSVLFTFTSKYRLYNFMYGTQLYKVLLNTCKNESNAPILILNTIQNVDFIM
jgi:predicted mannosyl-3-phosphoglycerate phosphatase (HAD superfamily)